MPAVAIAATLMLGALSPLARERLDRSTTRRPKPRSWNNRSRATATRSPRSARCTTARCSSTRTRRPRSPTRSGDWPAPTRTRSKLSGLVAARGAVLYHGAQDPTSLLPNTNIKSLNELGTRTMYGAVATGNDEQLIANLGRAQQDLKLQRKRFDKQVDGRGQQARLHRVDAQERRRGQLARDRAALAGEGRDRDAHRAGEGRGRSRDPPLARSARATAVGEWRDHACRRPTSAATRSRTCPHRRRAPRPRSSTPRRNSASRTATRRAARAPTTVPVSR